MEQRIIIPSAEWHDTLCECGHSIDGHGDNGCIHCECSRSHMIMELENEINVLHRSMHADINKLDVTTKALNIAVDGLKHIRSISPAFHPTKEYWIADDTLTKIERLK
jgi:predicted DNA-binding protein (MmcQ/YjbR family)